MDAKDILNIFKANARLILEDGIEVNDIKNIPKVWSNFLESDNQWVGLDLKLDSTNLIFKGIKDSEVSKHYHLFSDELTFVLDGEVELITPKGIKIYNRGESFFIDKGVEHIVKFKKDSTLLATFTPKMNGLEIEFKE